jgi:translation initiation factor 1 (eIF-1/SUI1)
MKTLQGTLGCGATFKEGRLEFQGDCRDKIAAHFEKNGLKLVRAGG